MTNEISINWNKNQRTERPIFEAFDEAALEDLQYEAMALYGEACYIEDSIQDYIMEAASETKGNEPGVLTSVGRLIKNLVGRFIRAITRFMTNHQCKKAVEFFNDAKNRSMVKDYIKANWKLEKTDPGYAFMQAVVVMKVLLKHVSSYEKIFKAKNKDELIASLGDNPFGGINDTTYFAVTDVTPQKIGTFIDKMFGGNGIYGSDKTLNDIIHQLETFNTRWTPYDSKDSPVVKMITSDIKAFATFQSRLLTAYKFFSTVEKDSVLKGLHENNKKLSDIKDQAHEMNEKADKSANKTEKDIPIDYKKMMSNHLDDTNKSVKNVQKNIRNQDEKRYAELKRQQEEDRRKEEEEEARLRKELGDRKSVV